MTGKKNTGYKKASSTEGDSVDNNTNNNNYNNNKNNNNNINNNNNNTNNSISNTRSRITSPWLGSSSSKNIETTFRSNNNNLVSEPIQRLTSDSADSEVSTDKGLNNSLNKNFRNLRIDTDNKIVKTFKDSEFSKSITQISPTFGSNTRVNSQTFKSVASHSSMNNETEQSIHDANQDVNMLNSTPNVTYNYQGSELRTNADEYSRHLSFLETVEDYLSGDIINRDIRNMVDLIPLETPNFMFSPYNPMKLMAFIFKQNLNNIQAYYSDLVKLISASVHLGTNIDKYAAKLEPRYYEELRRLLTKYSVLRRVGNNKRDEAITMSRLQSTFPHLAALILLKFPKRDNIEVQNLPHYLRFPAAPSIIPRGKKYESLLNDFTTWAVSFDVKINPKNPNSDRVKEFIRISHESIYIPEEVRVEIIEKLESSLNPSSEIL